MNDVKNALIRQTAGDRIFKWFVYFYLSASFLIVLYPLVYVVSASFSDMNAVLSARVWLWPVDPTLEVYAYVFNSQNIINGYRNSIVYTAVGTAFNLAVTVLAAYPLSRKELKGRAVFTGFFAFTMLFSGGMIATYVVVSMTGLLNSMWALIIPASMSVWNMIIMRTYFQSSIPEELYESACLDGCDDGRYLLTIILPLSKTILAVVAMFYAVGHWNSYFSAMLYLRDMKKYPLQLVLREILILGQMESDMIRAMDAERARQGIWQVLKYAVIVVSSVPMLVVYGFIQKSFIKGVMIGAIKG